MIPTPLSRVLAYEKFKLDHNISKQSARLIYESFAEFYDMFSSDLSAIEENIINQMGLAMTEVSETYCLLKDSAVYGIYSAYPSAEMKDRQMTSLKTLLSISPLKEGVLDLLRNYRQQIPAISSGSFYLSRIAVLKAQRGAGFGQQLLQAFEGEAKSKNFGIVTLHVNAANDRAIRFYKAAGYSIASIQGTAYTAMEKKLSS